MTRPTLVLVLSLLSAAPSLAQQTAPSNAARTVATPEGYVIGTDDVLGVLFWREEGMSADVRVRPDGRISLPLLNEVAAVGLTPEQLRERLTEAAKAFIAEPNVSVVVREINSRRVYITGQVARPNFYNLTAPTTVLQLIALAGGVTEFAESDDVVIIRPGVAKPFPFKYNDVRKGKNTQQNIELMVGDTVVVP